jgi:hypothetical protein
MSDAFSLKHRAREIRYISAEKRLEVDFEDGAKFSYPAEYLRVESPSAEVQGHGPGQKQIVAGRRHVGILEITQSRSASTISTTPGSFPGTTCTSWAGSRPRSGRPIWPPWISRASAGSRRAGPDQPHSTQNDFVMSRAGETKTFVLAQ